MIKRSIPWSSQPQGVVPIDRSGTLFDASKISVVMAPGSGSPLIDALSGIPFTTSSTLVREASSLGVGVKWAAGTSNNITFAADADSVLDTTSCSMLIATVRTGASGYSGEAYGYSDGASSRSFCYLPYTDNTLYWDFGNATVGSGRLTVSMAPYMAVGTVNIWGLYAGTRGREIWRNGVLLASNTGATATRGTTAATFRSSINTAPASNDSLFVLSKEGWAQSTFKELTRNPWRVFAPQQRNIYVSVAAGGDVSVNVTGVTSTTGLGTVTVTAIQNASISVTGLTGTSALGTVSVLTGGSVDANVTGVTGTTSLGTVTVTAIQNAITSVTGLTGTTGLGSVTVDVGGSVSASVTGVTGTASLGTVSVTAVRVASVSVTGVTGTSALGTVSVTIGSSADVSVSVTGVTGTTDLGRVLVWGLIDTSQTPNWVRIAT